MAANGALVGAEELLRLVWDEHADPFTNAVRLAMSRLRSKLGEPRSSPRCPASATGRQARHGGLPHPALVARPDAHTGVFIAMAAPSPRPGYARSLVEHR
ncbi:hypothetical protein Amsp01_089010 [Amycolatopsis sp. NBRC 101858]|nr:hypothetical protein Amsp01_089010 [Amycolatopsis sp. NBRC 101858]